MSIIKIILIIFFLVLSVFYIRDKMYGFLIISLLAIIVTIIPKKPKTLHGMIMGVNSISHRKSILRLKTDERKICKIIIPNSVLDNIVLYSNVNIEISYLGNFVRFL